MIKRNKLTTSLAIAIASISVFGNIISHANNIKENNNYNLKSDLNTRASSSSTGVSKTVSGVKYTGKTKIETNTILKKVTASTIVETNNIVSSGRIGAHTALYKEGTGEAIMSSSWSYNNAAKKIHTVSVSKKSPVAGNYRAKGTMKSYNESNGTYVGTSLNPSGYLSYKSMNLTISDEELKERMTMYETKDMIAAEGINGNYGYISLEDMGVYENPSSPEEALRLQEERIRKYGEYKEINVYDNDGKTVVDKFRVYNM